jgi:hypothetical protein
MPNATDSALIRTRAIAESETLTRSTPESRRSRAASIVRSIRMLRGGSISTEITNRPAARRSARWVGGGASPAAVATGVRSTTEAGGRPTAISVRPLVAATLAAVAPAPLDSSASSAARISAMCSGVVPQQPPRIRAPAASNRGVTVPK